MAKPFQGKVTIVTGSSNGIGRGIATYFVRLGSKVTLTGRSLDALEETKQLCLSEGATEDDILIVPGSLDDEQVMTDIVKKTAHKFGQIDYLINNAGVSDEDMCGKTPGFFTQDMRSFDYIMKINLRCVIFLCRLIVPYLEKTKGNIVNIGSIANSDVQACSFTYYALSKAALDQFTRNIAVDLIAKGIRVNCIKPGSVRSTIMQKQGVSQDVIEETLHKKLNFDLIPAGFVGEPEDVAKLAAFLCDDAQSRFLVGQSIRLDGGTSLMNPLLTSSIMQGAMGGQKDD